MGRRMRNRGRLGGLIQGELLGTNVAKTADGAAPPAVTIGPSPGVAPTLHTSAAHEVPMGTTAPAVPTIVSAAPPSVPIVTVEGGPAPPGDELSPVEIVEVYATPAASPVVGSAPVGEPPGVALQIISETAETTPPPAVTAPIPTRLPSDAKQAAPSLTLEPPPSRSPSPRGGSRSQGKSEARATQAKRQEPSEGGYAANSSTASLGEVDVPGGRVGNGSSREVVASRARPAGEPLARARALVEQRKIQEAIELYLGILTVNPSNLKARNNLGVLFDELKQFDAARDHLEAAARLEPANVEVLTNLASTLTSLARYDEAETILRRAQKVDADDPRVRTSVGILFFRRGRYEQAETELRSVCARDHDNGAAFYYRGEALNRLGRYDEAVEALGRAAELLPNDPKPVYTLGHIYDRKHLPEEAAEMYRRARRLQKR